MAALVAVCSAVVSLAVPAAHSAHAAGLDQQCAGSVDLRFSPGLTNTPQTVQVFYNSTVTCPVVAERRVAGGTGAGVFTIPGATCTNVTTVPNTVNYTWFPRAASSTVNYSATSVNLQTVSQIVQTGSVSAGLLSGDQVHEVITLLNINLTACNTSTGLTFISGPEAIDFISL